MRSMFQRAHCIGCPDLLSTSTDSWSQPNLATSMQPCICFAQAAPMDISLLFHSPPTSFAAYISLSLALPEPCRRCGTSEEEMDGHSPKDNVETKITRRVGEVAYVKTLLYGRAFENTPIEFKSVRRASSLSSGMVAETTTRFYRAQPSAPLSPRGIHCVRSERALPFAVRSPSSRGTRGAGGVHELSPRQRDKVAAKSSVGKQEGRTLG